MEHREYVTKQLDGEAPIMLDLRGVGSTPLLLSRWEVAPNRIISMGRIELYSVLMLNVIVWNRAFYTYKNESGIK